MRWDEIWPPPDSKPSHRTADVGRIDPDSVWTGLTKQQAYYCASPKPSPGMFVGPQTGGPDRTILQP
jgi:hypothetical protein